MTRHFLWTLLLAAAISLVACQQQEVPALAPAGAKAAAEAQSPDSGQLPTPPLREDFEGEPKLSLFPRVGDFRPEEGDQEGLSFWATYIDHLTRTSGILTNKDAAKGRAFGFRGIKAAASSGFFSPLAVEPETGYRVSFRAWTKLPEGGVAGLGILEFDEFLWVPAQYPKSLSDKHFQKVLPGVQLTGSQDGAAHSFAFRTGPQTRMIHLVFFREGTPDREPVVIDDIEIRGE